MRHKHFIAIILVILTSSFVQVPVEAFAQSVTLSAQIQTLPVDKPSSSKNFAILIGFSDYSRGAGLQSLSAAHQDISALKKVLVDRVGYEESNVFEITERSFPTAQDISNRITILNAELPEDATILIYYVGHGFTFNGYNGNYLVPASFDNRISAPNSASATTIAMRSLVKLEKLLSELSRNGKRGIILFYNACRNDPFDESKPFSSNAILQGAGNNFSKQSMTELSKVSGVHAFFAAGSGGQAIARVDQSDKNELPFTLYGRLLIDALSKNPSIEFQNLDKQIHHSTIGIINEARARNILIDHPPTSHYRYQRKPLELDPQNGACLARAKLPNNSTTCTNSNGDPISSTSTDECSSSFQIWERLQKSEHLVEAFNAQYASCIGAKQLAGNWLNGMNEKWRSVQTASDVCAATKIFLQEFPETGYTTRAQGYLNSRLCNPIASFDAIKLKASKLFDSIKFQSIQTAAAELERSKNAFEAYSSIATVLQHSLRLQGCAVTSGGQLSVRTADGDYGAGSALGADKYDAAASSIQSCVPLRKLRQIGSKELQEDEAYLTEKWIPDALFNISSLARCMDYASKPVCGCGSDVTFESKGKICVEKKCPSGLRLNKSTGQCFKPQPKCTGGKKLYASKCVCPRGLKENSNGRCYKPTPTCKDYFVFRGQRICN